jgi:hypothetical protein
MKKQLIIIFTLIMTLCFVGVPASIQASTGKDVTKSFKDTKKVTKLVDELNDWCGYQYIYLLKSKEKQTVDLTDNTILNIAALNYYEPNLGEYASVTEKGILARTNLLFGKSPSLDSLKTYEDEKANELMNKKKEYICKLTGGGLATVYGDWGMLYPNMKVLSIVKTNDKQYQVKAKTYFTDAETKKKTDYGVTTLTIKESSKSKNGYVITGIKIQKTAK